MTEHHDALETRAPEAREADLFARLPAVLAAAVQAPAYARRLARIDPAAITDRNALSTLPVLRKSDAGRGAEEEPADGRPHRRTDEQGAARLHVAGPDL